MKEIFQSASNFVFIGESGAGKTEVSLNFAAAMKGASGSKVCLFDMDQTKPLIRAREAADDMKGLGVDLIWQEQLLDSPVIPPGVREALCRTDEKCVMDVGGSDLGSHMIGQFSDILNRGGSRTFFVVNPYRSWSRSAEGIEDTYQRLSRNTRISRMEVVLNPNLGPDTSYDEVREGIKRFEALLPDVKPAFLCVPEECAGDAAKDAGLPVLPVHLYIKEPWNK